MRAVTSVPTRSTESVRLHLPRSRHPVVSRETLHIQLADAVRPASLNVRGPTTPVVAGEMVSLTCTVEGARPAANITWYNRSEVIGPQPQTTMDLMSDGTYRTASSLVLVASRYDHKGEFFCKGINEVLRKRLEAPLLQATTLEVLCK
ncbi:ig-like domain-containing protein [Trichonephila clavipes]|nr:ig-like domain-containing protein [Trichonephila clavipes]